MDNATGNKAVIATGAHFKGQVKNAHAIEINGIVEADLKAEKVTIGTAGKFVGAINADLVVVSGHYDGQMDAGSIWATATAHIAGKIQYKTLQMDRGAALNCRVVHNWKPEKPVSKKASGKLNVDNSDANPLPELLAETEGSMTKETLGEGVVLTDVDDTSIKMLSSNPEVEAKKVKKPLRSRRLGIFGFGSKP
jgi:cytoskeletal protein CcmA (bactofilin family)